MTWQMASVLLGALGLFMGFLTKFSKSVSSNTQAMTELRCTMKSFTDMLGETKTEQHEIQGMVHDHETRIVVLEKER